MVEPPERPHGVQRETWRCCTTERRFWLNPRHGRLRLQPSPGTPGERAPPARWICQEAGQCRRGL